MYGILLIFISTIFNTSKDLLSKKISFGMHGSLSAFFSFLMALPWYVAILSLAYLLGFDIFEYKGEFLLFIILRACTDSIAELTKMHAISCGEISFISNFFSLTPIFLLFIGPLITGEQISSIGILGVIVVFLGTAILFRSPSNEIPWRGVILGITSSFFFSLNACFDRLAVTHGNPILSGFLMTVLSSMILFFPCIKLQKPMAQIKLTLAPLLFRGLFETLSMIFKLAGYQYLEPQYASGISKLTLVFSVIIGGSIFKEGDRKLRIISSTIIVIGSIIITAAKLIEG